jgi:hypothetical protein
LLFFPLIIWGNNGLLQFDFLFFLHRANATYFGNGWKPLFNSSYIEISYILCMFWYQWGMFFLYLSKY